MKFKRITAVWIGSGNIEIESLSKIIDALKEVDNFPSPNVLTEGKEDIDNLERKVQINRRIEHNGIYLEIEDRDKRDARCHHIKYFAKDINYSDKEMLKAKYSLII